jgi:hypothetical protein
VREVCLDLSSSLLVFFMGSEEIANTRKLILGDVVAVAAGGLLDGRHDLTEI